jgi:hypothetical protein
MNPMQFDSSTQSSTPRRLPVGVLTLLGLGYGMVGWHLAAHHIFLFVGVAIGVAALVFSWNSEPWFGGAFGNLPQMLFVALVISLLITLTMSVPLMGTLVIIPALTTFLAWQEMQTLKLPGSYVWKILILIILLGLGVGELIDLTIFPSQKG